MMPLRRGKGGRRGSPKRSKRDREEGASEPSEETAQERSKRQARAEREAVRSKPSKAKPDRARDRKPARARGKSPGAKPRRREGRPLLQRARAAARSAWSSPRVSKARSRAGKGAGVVLAWLIAGLKSLLAGLKVVGALALGGLQEIGSFWIRTAEILGGALLWVVRTVYPYLLAALRLTRRALAFAERVVTPKRALAVVVISAAIVLAISQFVDYRGIKIGAPAYAGVEQVAPAPQTDRQTTGSVHGYAMVPVALIVIAAAILALGGRWRLARVIPLLSALVIAVSLLLDARKGLQEGEAGLAYQGATAVLIEGFWLQIVSAAVLVVTGLLLTHYARKQEEPARRRRRAAKPEGSGRRRRFRIAGVRA